MMNVDHSTVFRWVRMPFTSPSGAGLSRTISPINIDDLRQFARENGYSLDEAKANKE